MVVKQQRRLWRGCSSRSIRGANGGAVGMLLSIEQCATSSLLETIIIRPFKLNMKIKIICITNHQNKRLKNVFKPLYLLTWSIRNQESLFGWNLFRFFFFFNFSENKCTYVYMRWPGWAWHSWAASVKCPSRTLCCSYFGLNMSGGTGGIHSSGLPNLVLV